MPSRRRGLVDLLVAFLLLTHQCCWLGQPATMRVNWDLSVQFGQSLPSGRTLGPQLALTPMQGPRLYMVPVTDRAYRPIS
jgi:hypothetical protein